MHAGRQAEQGPTLGLSKYEVQGGELRPGWGRVLLGIGAFICLLFNAQVMKNFNFF